MNITILIWTAIIILWSVKTASDQKKRTQRPIRRDDDERVAPPIETEARRASPVLRPAGWKHGERVEEIPAEPLFAEAVSLETIDYDAPADSLPAAAAPRNRNVHPATATPLGVRPTAAPRNIVSATAAPKEEPAASASAWLSATDGQLGEQFDLRRAVIYSEILKPKFED